MNYQIFIFSRRQLKVIIIGTLIGGLLQIICAQYVSAHPELFEDPTEKEPLTTTRNRRFFSPRGGANRYLFKDFVLHKPNIIISIISKHGFLGSLIGSVFVVKSDSKALVKLINGALPYSHSNAGKQKWIAIPDDRLDLCDQGLRYLLKVLLNPNIPGDEKKDASLKVLKTFLNVTKNNKRTSFIICMALILQILSHSEYSSFVIVLKTLIQAIKEGKVSKKVARAIIRRLIRQNIEIDPELIEIASSS